MNWETLSQTAQDALSSNYGWIAKGLLWAVGVAVTLHGIALVGKFLKRPWNMGSTTLGFVYRVVAGVLSFGVRIFRGRPLSSLGASLYKRLNGPIQEVTHGTLIVDSALRVYDPTDANKIRVVMGSTCLTDELTQRDLKVLSKKATAIIVAKQAKEEAERDLKDKLRRETLAKVVAGDISVADITKLAKPEKDCKDECSEPKPLKTEKEACANIADAKVRVDDMLSKMEALISQHKDTLKNVDMNARTNDLLQALRERRKNLEVNHTA